MYIITLNIKITYSCTQHVGMTETRRKGHKPVKRGAKGVCTKTVQSRQLEIETRELATLRRKGMAEGGKGER